MTATFPPFVDHPMAWRGSDIKSKDDIAFDLTARQQSALEELLARSEFEDWDEPERKRLMLRLWLDAESNRRRRPVVPQIHIYENAGGRSGIDPQPGRMPAVAAYRTPDEMVRRPAPAA